MKNVIILITFIFASLLCNAQNNTNVLKPTIKSTVYLSDAEKPLKKAVPKFSLVYCNVLMDSVETMYITRNFVNGVYTTADTSYYYVPQKYASLFFTLKQCPVGTTFRDFVHSQDACVVVLTGYWDFDE